jgi:MarR family transcriptional regulator, organic hydroperoxide resistance regulator
MTLKKELQMESDFNSLAQELILSISKTQSLLDSMFNKVFIEHKLTPSQFNILRILKGNKSKEGMTCSDIGARMIWKDSDLTRLLDKLVKKKYVKRKRTPEDRRKIFILLTDEGRQCVATVSPLLNKIEKGALSHMSDEKCKKMIKLLEETRKPHI